MDDNGSFDSYIKEHMRKTNCSTSVVDKYTNRLRRKRFSIDENPISHFGVYFPPYNAKNRKVFLILHKKSGLWLFPGGHVDKFEHPKVTLQREVREELGISLSNINTFDPFLLSVTSLYNKGHSCRMHYDIWFLLPTDGRDFILDQKEFIDSKWLAIDSARRHITDSANLEALDRIGDIESDLSGGLK